MSNPPEITGPTPPTPPPRLSLPPQAVIGLGLVFGLGMIGVALVWALVTGTAIRRAWYPPTGWPREVLLGTALGLGGAGLAWTLTHSIPALRALERMLVDLLDMRKLRYHHALLLGLVAGIPEEILFRGALQPSAGLLLAAVIFGALHGVSVAYFLYATGAGLLLGALANWRGDLWAASAAHIAIDAALIALMLHAWRRSHTPERHG